MYRTEIQKANDSIAPTVAHVWYAQTPWQRLRGLLGRAQLEEREGLLLSPCHSIHTLGMRYPLDIVFLDAARQIIKCVPHLKPFRLAAARDAHYTLELTAGRIARANIKVGDQLRWRME